MFVKAGNEDDDTDGEYSDSGAEETQLESFQTPLDDERCPVDEYVAFKEILSSKTVPFIDFNTMKSHSCMVPISYVHGSIKI